MTIDPLWDFDTIESTTRSADDSITHPEITNALMASVLADTPAEAPVITAPGNPFVDLPGGLYLDGNLIRTAQVRELTGEDEEALAAVKGSLSRWIGVLLDRVVVRIGDHTPTPAMIRNLLIGDRDALLLAARITAFGPSVTLYQVICPGCDTAFDATVDLTTVDTVRLDPAVPRHEYQVPLRHGATAQIRLPNGVVQEAVFADEQLTRAQRNTALLGKCLIRVTDAGGMVRPLAGAELAQKMGSADRQTILQFLTDTQPGPRLDDIRCEHTACGQEVRLPLTLPDLFRI